MRCSAFATIPACADAESEWRCRCRRSRRHAEADVRSGRGRRGAVHRERRASARRDPARSGRQRPGRDGGRVHARRIRCDRRAHDRSAGRPHASSPTSQASPRAAVSVTATCSARAAAGPRRSSTTMRCASSSRASSPTTSKFALGVCNGCQMMAALKDIVPGATHWPRFVRNASEQYEARLVTLEVLESPSMFFAGMAGSRIPVAVAHGEGRTQFARPNDAQRRARVRALRRQPRRMRPSVFRSTRTARPTASPASRRPMVA